MTLEQIHIEFVLLGLNEEVADPETDPTGTVISTMFYLVDLYSQDLEYGYRGPVEVQNPFE